MQEREEEENSRRKIEKPRRELPPIKVWVNEEEKKELLKLAKKAGIPLSSYMKIAGLNQKIKSHIDHQSVADLVKINGDLGRVAGLLKLWLLEKRGQGSNPLDVEKMMKDFRFLQQEIRLIMTQIIS